jgi:hypothetical protein
MSASDNVTGPQAHLPCQRCRIAGLIALLTTVFLALGLTVGVIKRRVRRVD